VWCEAGHLRYCHGVNVGNPPSQHAIGAMVAQTGHELATQLPAHPGVDIRAPGDFQHARNKLNRHIPE
jgi:hypothetical protein